MAGNHGNQVGPSPVNVDFSTFLDLDVSSERDGPGPDREEDGEAEKAVADLKDQMNELKTRYRVERRLLETRSFEPKKG